MLTTLEPVPEEELVVSSPASSHATTTTTTATTPSGGASPAPTKAGQSFKPTAADDESFPSISMDDEPEEAPQSPEQQKGKDKDASGSWDSCESVTEEELPRMCQSTELETYAF